MSWHNEELNSKKLDIGLKSWDDVSSDEETLGNWDEEEEIIDEIKKPVQENIKENKKKIGFNNTKISKEDLRRIEIKSDLSNVNDLFGIKDNQDDLELSESFDRDKFDEKVEITMSNLISNITLDKLPLFHPETKQDYEKLRKNVSLELVKLFDKSMLNYSSSLAIDLIRDIAKPLSVENLRKIISTLNLLIKDKEKLIKELRMQKTGGTSLGGAGKKKVKPSARLNTGPKKDTYDLLSEDDFI